MIYLLLFSVLTLSTFGMHNVYKIQLENKKKMILSFIKHRQFPRGKQFEHFFSEIKNWFLFVLFIIIIILKGGWYFIKLNKIDNERLLTGMTHLQI